MLAPLETGADLSATVLAAMFIATSFEPTSSIQNQRASGERNVSSPKRPARLRVRLRRDRNWFGIAGELKVEHGRIELAVLLNAARR